MRLSGTLIYGTVVASLGGLLFGFDTIVISGTTDDLEKLYRLSPFWKGFTVASALIGTVVGSLVFGQPADRYGRRTLLIAMALLYLVSAVGCALAWDWWSLLAFRFIGGLGVGGASVISPLYIAEIAPASHRGRLVAVQQFNIVLGILLAYLSNYLVAQWDLGETTWRWMFGVEAAPAALFLATLWLVPRSPRWLVAQGRLDEATATLERLGTDGGTPAEEVETIRKSLVHNDGRSQERFWIPKYRHPIQLAVAIAMFNQLSGINAILYYAPEVFRMAGAGDNSSLLQPVALGLVNLVFTMLALGVIDAFGRRTLMLVGSIGYIVSLLTITAAFLIYGSQFDAIGGTVVLGSLMVFIAAHAFGQGAVIWVFIGEIFPNSVRARGQALGSFTHWIMAALISWTFPVIADAIGPATVFATYALMMVLQLGWVLIIMPETKLVPLEQMHQRLQRGRSEAKTLDQPELVDESKSV